MDGNFWKNICSQLVNRVAHQSDLFQESYALPTFYFDIAPLPPTAREGIESILAELVSQLQSTMLEPSIFPTKGQQLLDEVEQLLAIHKPEDLAPEARCLRVRAQDLRVELRKKLGSAVLTEVEASTRQLVEFSKQQLEATSWPKSILIQGRSGTGKTLVLVQRILNRFCNSQLFITKSSMLRDEVIKQLKLHDCNVVPPLFPPAPGILCVTWDEFVQLLNLPARNLSYDDFQRSIWPHMQTKSRGLAPQLVWSEFNTRLRPFGPALALGFASAGVWQLTFDEYEAEDVGAMGVALSTWDHMAIFQMFEAYTKYAARDDVAVALQVAQHAAQYKFDAVHIDEVQDFVPAQIASLMSLCSDLDGISVAGDTCQTINPGSAFSFQQLTHALCKHRAGCTSEHAKEAAKALQEQRARDGKKNAKALKKHRRHMIAQALASQGVQLHGMRQAAQATEKKCDDEHLDPSAADFKQVSLNFNYRCSPGVSQLASSVARLLLARFPHGADHIEEVALSKMSASTIPLYLQVPKKSDSVETMREIANLIMGTGSRRMQVLDPTRIALIVKSDYRRQCLRNSGVNGLILTVLEAKGLEFDFVVLCGLLEDCSDQLFWSLADDASKESKLVAQAPLSRNNRGDRLSEVDRKLLCRLALAIPELKNLYVAISRARTGCFFVEAGDGQTVPWKSLLRHWHREAVIQCSFNALEYVKRQCLAPDGKTYPSIIEVLEKHLGHARGTNDMDMVGLLHERGAQLLAHAADDPYERRHVFEEAVQVLQSCMQTHLKGLRKQLAQLAARVANMYSVHNHADVQRWLQSIHAIASTVFLVSGTCTPFGKGHCLFESVIRQRHLFNAICSFLSPSRSIDTHNTVGLVLEKLHAHTQAAQNIKTDIILGKAWADLMASRQEYVTQRLQLGTSQPSVQKTVQRFEKYALLCICFTSWSCYSKPHHIEISSESLVDPLESARMNMNKMVEKALRRRSNEIATDARLSIKQPENRFVQALDSAQGIREKLAVCLAQAHVSFDSLVTQAQRCAASGRGFLTVRRPDLAGKSFGEAAQIMAYISKIVREQFYCKAKPLLSFPVPWTKAASVQMCMSQAKIYAWHASLCWVSAHKSASDSSMESKDALRKAIAYLEHAGHYEDSAAMAISHGRFREAIQILSKAGESALTRQLVWLCAVSLASKGGSGESCQPQLIRACSTSSNYF